MCRAFNTFFQLDWKLVLVYQISRVLNNKRVGNLRWNKYLEDFITFFVILTENLTFNWISISYTKMTCSEKKWPLQCQSLTIWPVVLVKSPSQVIINEIDTLFSQLSQNMMIIDDSLKQCRTVHCKCLQGITGSLRGNRSAGISNLWGLW